MDEPGVCGPRHVIHAHTDAPNIGDEHTRPADADLHTGAAHCHADAGWNSNASRVVCCGER